MRDQHIRARRPTGTPGEAERNSCAMRVIGLVDALSRARVSRKPHARHCPQSQSNYQYVATSLRRLWQLASRRGEIEIARAIEAGVERVHEVPVRLVPLCGGRASIRIDLARIVQLTRRLVAIGRGAGNPDDLLRVRANDRRA